MKSLIKSLAVAALFVTSASAEAATTFDLTGSMNDNGAYGNSFSRTVGALTVQLTGWQAKQSDGTISTAWVGAYSPGTGVTGINDQYGNNGYHQIDNAVGYTDFVMLQFSQAVTLDSIDVKSFSIPDPAHYNSWLPKDNDLAFAALGNVNSNLALLNNSAISWTTLAGNGSDHSVSTGSGTASTRWLIGAAPNSGNNDAFKINAVRVTAAVPEPATWAMMLVGFGATGAALRRRRVRPVAAAA